MSTSLAKTEDVVELAMELINIESVTHNEYPMATALKSWLEPRGFTVKLQFVADNHRYNVLAYPQNTNPKEAKLLINSHIDTVPPYFGPATIKNNKIYGRGACDTKSIIAAQLITANTLYKKYNISNFALLYTVGEEIDSIGMRKANELNLNAAQFCIVGEPTESKTIIGQKGCYSFELKSKGKAAHSAYPQRGQCALTPLLNILHAIRNETWPKDKLFGDTTVNIWIEKGGVAANVIPEDASAKVLFRVTTNPQFLEQKVRGFIKKYDIENQITYKVINCHPPIKLETVDDEKYKPYLVSYTTDIPLCKNIMDGKCRAVLFGAGSITVAHSDHEHVDIDELRRSVPMYIDIALTLFKRCKVKSKL